MKQPEAPTEDSNLVSHAQREMRLAGLYDDDADYDGMAAQAVEELVRTFAGQGHSGFSAGLVLAVFDKVARFHTLTPITSDPSEWQDVSEASGYAFWQSRRDPAVFSKDGGQSWYHLDDGDAGDTRVS